MAMDQNEEGRRAGWIRERSASDALEHPAPVHANNLDFIFGALTLVALALLAVTGSVLTMYYNPAPLAAHDSMRYLITGVPIVALLRDVHIWSASSAFVLAFSHLAFVFWRRGFRRPREGMWWTGVLLLAIMFGLAFTGTVLRADQEAVEALAHASVGARYAGPAAAVLRPDFTPSTPLLTRIYSLHIAVLPLALTALLSLHLWLIRQLSLSARNGIVVPWRSRLRPLGGFVLLLVALIATLALAFPRGLLPAGVSGFELTKPFWPFLWIYAAESLFGMNGMLIAPAVLFGFLALVPVADRTDGRLARTTRFLGVVLFVLMIAAIAYAVLAPAQPHLGMAM